MINGKWCLVRGQAGNLIVSAGCAGVLHVEIANGGTWAKDFGQVEGAVYEDNIMVFCAVYLWPY